MFGLFKVNVDKLKKKGNTKKLAKLLRKSNDPTLRKDAANALASLEWQAENKEEKLLYLLAKGCFEQIDEELLSSNKAFYEALTFKGQEGKDKLLEAVNALDAELVIDSILKGFSKTNKYAIQDRYVAFFINKLAPSHFSVALHKIIKGNEEILQKLIQLSPSFDSKMIKDSDVDFIMNRILNDSNKYGEFSKALLEIASFSKTFKNYHPKIEEKVQFYIKEVIEKRKQGEDTVISYNKLGKYCKILGIIKLESSLDLLVAAAELCERNAFDALAILRGPQAIKYLITRACSGKGVNDLAVSTSHGLASHTLNKLLKQKAQLRTEELSLLKDAVDELKKNSMVDEWLLSF